MVIPVNVNKISAIGNIRKLESLSIFSVDCLIMSSAVSDTKHECCMTDRQTHGHWKARQKLQDDNR